MKNHLLLFLIISFNCSVLSGQNITNTIWENTTDDTQLYFQIRNDTSFWGTHKDTLFLKSSKVIILTDTIIWIDLPSAEQCSSQDSGIYKYYINQDVLNFELIKDNCTDREQTLTKDDWKIASITTNIPTQELTLFTLYPNPCAQNRLYIHGITTESISHINIYNTSGRAIVQISNQTSNFIDVSNIRKGVYIVIIETRDGQIFSYNKFVKQ